MTYIWFYSHVHVHVGTQCSSSDCSIEMEPSRETSQGSEAEPQGFFINSIHVCLVCVCPSLYMLCVCSYRH